jgi:DNA adenine methylase
LKRIECGSFKGATIYKRVAVSPIRYVGGKSLGVGHVIKLLPDDITRVVSPFFGGGSVEIAMSKFLDIEVIGYDIFDILVNYWNVQIKNRALLHDALSLLKPDRETYTIVKAELRRHWEGTKVLDPLTLAAFFFFNFNLSYGPGFLGWTSDIYLDATKYSMMIDKVQKFKPGKLSVSTGGFEETIEKHHHDFLYCDPPYYIGDDSKMFKGVYPSRDIPIYHNEFKHDVLRDLLNDHDGGFILSYNDCPTIREWYRDYEQSFPKWQYTMGQGETRIGKNRVANGRSNIKESHEMLIFCPPR